MLCVSGACRGKWSVARISGLRDLSEGVTTFTGNQVLRRNVRISEPGGRHISDADSHLPALQPLLSSSRNPVKQHLNKFYGLIQGRGPPTEYFGTS
eukprot:364314-Chlamydomonas_euryale.AAC.17